MTMMSWSKFYLKDKRSRKRRKVPVKPTLNKKSNLSLSSLRGSNKLRNQRKKL